MSTTTRFVAQIVIQRIVTTTSDHPAAGFGSPANPQTKERVTTLLSSGFEDEDLMGVTTKSRYALNLAFPTVKGEPADASPSS